MLAYHYYSRIRRRPVRGVITTGDNLSARRSFPSKGYGGHFHQPTILIFLNGGIRLIETFETMDAATMPSPAKTESKLGSLPIREIRKLPIEQRIQAFRERADISINAAANQIGVSPGTWNDWEKKRANPSRDNLIAMAEVLGIEPVELL